MDTRSWDLMGTVFPPEAKANLADNLFPAGGEQIIASIKGAIEAGDVTNPGCWRVLQR